MDEKQTPKISLDGRDFVSFALDEYREGKPEFDEWLRLTFSEERNLHILLRTCIWARTEAQVRLDEIISLRRELTFANRANASKRRHLRSLQARFDRRGTLKDWFSWVYMLAGMLLGYWWKT